MSQPSQQPPRRRGPVIAVVAGLVGVLAVLGVTGFVTPGFFLDEENSGATAGDPAGGEAVINAFLDAINNGDIQSANGKLCDAKISAWEIEMIEDLVPKHASLHVDGSPEITDLGGGNMSVIADLAGSWDDGDLEGDIGGAFREAQYGDWCILSFTTGKPLRPLR